uniref:hypothetical protein n=1 Tax=Catelliglobosispora koreensis TaxID=129052 RepID=UPI001B7FA9F8
TPPNWTAPTRLSHDGIRTEAITRNHLAQDVRGNQRQYRLEPLNRGGLGTALAGDRKSWGCQGKSRISSTGAAVAAPLSTYDNALARVRWVAGQLADRGDGAPADHRHSGLHITCEVMDGVMAGA